MSDLLRHFFSLFKTHYRCVSDPSTLPPHTHVLEFQAAVARHINKYRCSMKPTPAASNLLDQLWGCFPANSCMDTSTSLATVPAAAAATAAHLVCTFKADRSCRAQLWMQHCYPFFPHYCRLYVRSAEPNQRTAIRDSACARVCVCVCLCLCVRGQ